MTQTKNDVRLGRFISLVLRHDPAAAGISLDENGWATIADLLTGMRSRGYAIDEEVLLRIVAENDKSRYSLSDDGLQIRANQGHSIEVDVELTQSTPPPVLYHGTALRFLDSIKSTGLRPQKRQYVHLSSDMDTAIRVGQRHGAPVVLHIDSAAMDAKHYVFLISKNQVWQTAEVPWQYITHVEIPQSL